MGENDVYVYVYVKDSYADCLSDRYVKKELCLLLILHFFAVRLATGFGPGKIRHEKWAIC